MSDTNGKDKKNTDSEIRYVNVYESEAKIYTRKIGGFFANIRRYTGLPLIAAFLILPWLVIDGRPAVFFDLPTRQFHILWMTFWPQDFMLLAWVLIIAAFLLFTVTVLFGRVWCGFTCPQTVWTLMYIAVGHFFEGDRNKQIKLDQQPWSFEKIWRKAGKHSVWLLIAFVTGFTFIGYFYPVRELLIGFVPMRDAETGIIGFSAPAPAIFWTLFFTGMTYLNAGWLREQVCKYMCPYARFQSVMYDKDTLAVLYNEKRGEKRGPRKNNSDYKKEGLGDCIDCSWCVQVCPVDIDIRDGAQYECINCGLCVDACNSVMDKLGYEKNLISFTSEDAIETGHTKVVRLRVVAYALTVVAMISAFTYVLANRSPVGVDVIRDRGARLYRVRGPEIQNVYTIKINNMDNVAHSYDVEVEGKYPFEVRKYRPMQVEAGEVFTVPLRVVVAKNALKSEKSKMMVTVRSRENPEITAQEETNFIGPAK
ncbi:cytochrome c oxidase accessory protein CcoG [Agaribacterium haliotis]|uniref:cytochrome c oxidase accessory protein CcoG n=1 Tax=Agaribacterium haliotis TaxID=2013869 RepID=UPI000BB57EE5|nr:cytochrome c oxidase accessory protein CcoG [Agaribacterium haliotis]